jgi:hypothetical protein
MGRSLSYKSLNKLVSYLLYGSSLAKGENTYMQFSYIPSFKVQMPNSKDFYDQITTSSFSLAGLVMPVHVLNPNFTQILS